MKICRKCKIEKEINEFHKNKNLKDGVADWCKDCCKNYRISNIEIYTKYYEVHREQHDESRKRWYKSHREHCINYAKEYQKAHKEQYSNYVMKYLLENKDRIKTRHKEWMKNNNGKCRLYSQNKRALKRSLPSTLSNHQWEQITQHFNNKCAYCGKAKKLQQDHFVALSKNGEYSHNNILPVCKECNQSKHNSSFFEWYPKQKFYLKKREEEILEFLNYDNGIQQLSI